MLGLRILWSFAMKNIAACALLTGAMATFNAQAVVWVHVDANGVTHFASEQMDDRYALFYRSPAPTQSGDATAAAQAPSRPAELKDVRPSLATYFESSPRYRQLQPLIREAARIYRIDYELLQGLIAVESAFAPEIVSNKGAIGLMQVLPDTARRFGVDSDRWSSVESKLKNPRMNLQLGSRYLRFLIDLFPGRLDLALASYNAGEGAVQKAGNAIPNFRETQHYVATVTQLYTLLKPPPVVVASKPTRNASYGAGFVLTTPREPYALVHSGRGNMVAPIRTGVSSDQSLAVE
jgi:soluble lytic murein transglycosylase-like protein